MFAVGSLSGFCLPLPVVPLYAATAGADGAGVGQSTGAMMLSTVLPELAVPRMVARVGYRAVMALGLILLGAPAATLATSPTLPLVLAASLARGAGLGIVLVAGTALAAEIVPAERRGEGLGVYGVAAGAPAVACLPLGVWLTGHVGYPPVFLAGAALPLAGLLATIGLPARRAEVQRHGAVLGTFRVPGPVRPAVVFAAVMLAAGVVVTFLPLAVPASSRQFAAVALLAQASLTPVARWAAGRYGDRHGFSRLLVPAVLAAALGTASIGLGGQPACSDRGYGVVWDGVRRGAEHDPGRDARTGAAIGVWPGERAVEHRLRRRDGGRRRRRRPAGWVGRLHHRVRPDRGRAGRRAHTRPARRLI
ncbi:MAG TPA: MFS transporter [Jatrophihabitantaceae bacterium]